MICHRAIVAGPEKQNPHKSLNLPGFLVFLGDKMRTQDTEHVETKYLIETEVFRKDVCADFDHKMVARALLKRRVLMPRSDGSLSRQERIPGLGKFMFYRVLPSMFMLKI